MVAVAADVNVDDYTGWWSAYPRIEFDYSLYVLGMIVVADAAEISGHGTDNTRQPRHRSKRLCIGKVSLAFY